MPKVPLGEPGMDADEFDDLGGTSASLAGREIAPGCELRIASPPKRYGRLVACRVHRHPRTKDGHSSRALTWRRGVGWVRREGEPPEVPITPSRAEVAPGPGKRHTFQPRRGGHIGEGDHPSGQEDPDRAGWVARRGIGQVSHLTARKPAEGGDGLTYVLGHDGAGGAPPGPPRPPVGGERCHATKLDPPVTGESRPLVIVRERPWATASTASGAPIEGG